MQKRRLEGIRLTQSLSFFVLGTPISSNVLGPLPGFLDLEGGGAVEVGAVVGLGLGGALVSLGGGFGSAGLDTLSGAGLPGGAV